MTPHIYSHKTSGTQVPVESPPFRSVLRRLGSARALAPLAATLLVVGACSAGEGEPFTATTVPPVESSVSVPNIFEGLDPVDTRTVELVHVEGADPEVDPVEILGGDASLSGVVTTGGDPVAGATVRLIRVVDSGRATHEVTTGPNGGWVAEDLLGGRYAVQAWKSPSLALDRARSLFLEEGQEQEVDLDLDRVLAGGTLAVSVSTGGLNPVVGESIRLRVRAFEELDGAIIPFVGGLISMTGFDNWDIDRISVSTDADGVGTWTAICTATGVQKITVDVAGTSHTLEPPRCTASTAGGEGDEDDEDPDDEDAPAGDPIAVPAAGPFPPGRYVSDDDHFCETVFEEKTGSGWSSEPRVARGWSFTAEGQIRSLDAAPGSEPCTFARES